jgi:tetratricopeptide (TPR) repeat protein
VEARGAFERTLVLAPDDLPARIALGRTYLAAGDFDRSQLEAQGALEIDPESASAMLLLAETATDSGEFAVAVQWYESLLAQQPEANRLYKPLALAYRGAGREEDARRALGLAGEERVRLSDPLMQALRPGAKGALSFRQSGIAAFQRGDYATAEVQFRRAIELAPDYEGDRLNLGSTLTQLGRLEEAADEMRAVLAMNPAHALAQYNLGVVLDALGRRPEAIEAYTAALRIEPSAYRPRFNLATALREEGRCVTALEEYARILHGFPGDRSARVGEALCLVSEGSFDRAREGLESALSDSPGDPWLTYVTSRLLAASPQSEMRDGARALELARSLVEIQVSPGNLETLAMALAEVGRFDEAIATQTEAIELAATEAREALFPRLRENLERYKQRVPAREPALG